MASDGRAARYVAIITDGNGRWAQQRGLPVIEGHQAGADVVKARLRDAVEFGLRELTVYSFSTENWSRPAEEVAFLLNFNRVLLRRRRDSLSEMGVRIRRLGRRDGVPDDLLQEFDEADRVTKYADKLDLLVCFNYGGRAELEDAAKAGSIPDHLYAPDVPDVDLLIRTSGERRLSNFLLWQSAYAELYFTDVLWPDFDRRSLAVALEDYGRRQRRFGGLSADSL